MHYVVNGKEAFSACPDAGRNIMKAVRRKKYRRQWLVLFFLVFVGILDYPFLSRLYNERVQGQAVVSYRQSIEKLQKEEREERLQKARAYNQRLARGGGAALKDTFWEAKREGSGQDKVVRALLGAGEEDAIGTIEIPKIQVCLPIYADTSEEALQRGAGLLEGSSLPIGGESTHTCISAHRGLPGKAMFTSLDLLEEGDLFIITVLGEALAYEVSGIRTVEPYEVDALGVRPVEDLATLITCTPYGINTHRLYVHGKRVELPQGEEAQGRTPKESLWRRWGWVPVNLILLLWLILLLALTGHRRKGTDCREDAGQREEVRGN